MTANNDSMLPGFRPPGGAPPADWPRYPESTDSELPADLISQYERPYVTRWESTPRTSSREPSAFAVAAPTRLDVGTRDRLPTNGPAQAAISRPIPRLGRLGPWHRFTAGRRALAVIVVVQALLSAHLLWANTAYQDEALYLYTGHLEWSHWLSGTPIPQFQTYFSGAPVIYPPLGAAADALGGLAAARALSLCLMLGATIALHGVTRRIFGRGPATFAAAIFAGIGATQYLGAFATYDALALALVALATWLGVRAVAARRHSLALAAVAGLALSLADATKYAATLFDPMVVLVVMLFAWHRHGRRFALQIAAVLCAALVVPTAGALELAGHSYWRGIMFTTLARQPSNAQPMAVLVVSLGWMAAVATLAAIGAVIIRCWFTSRPYWMLGLTLALAVWIAPAEQAHIYTVTSLFKHVGFGEWFGSIAAGLALAAIITAVPQVKAEAALRASWAVVVGSAVFGSLLATNQFTAWPNTSKLVKTLRPMLKGRDSVLAADNGNVVDYYLPERSPGSREFSIDEQAQWHAGFDGDGFSYRNPSTGLVATGLKGYKLAIKNGYFTVITLSNYHTWLSADQVIRGDIAEYGDYRLVARIPYLANGEQKFYQVWAHDEETR